MINNVAGEVSSVDPVAETTKHTTSVPLNSDLAGIISVSVIVVPFSLIEPRVTPGKFRIKDPFILQLISWSNERCRHLNTASTADSSSSVILDGYSRKSTM
jgi:hypothetical protein